jgi:GAF domain-containing protein
MEPIKVSADTFAVSEWTPAPALPPLVARLLATVGPLLGSAACSVALVEGGRSLRFVAASGKGAGDIVGQSMPTDRGVAGWAVTTGQAISVGDVESDARFHRDLAESTGYVPNHITAVPIMGDDDAVGVLEVLDGAHEQMTSSAGTAALHGLAATTGELIATLGGGSSTSALQRSTAEALSRLDDADPELLEHVAAVIQALAGGRGGYRR